MLLWLSSLGLLSVVAGGTSPAGKTGHEDDALDGVVRKDHDGVADPCATWYDATNHGSAFRNVKHFGAAGDGKTDDTAAIRAAITHGQAVSGNKASAMVTHAHARTHIRRCCWTDGAALLLAPLHLDRWTRKPTRHTSSTLTPRCTALAPVIARA